MKLSGLLKRKWNYHIISFLIPFLGLLLVMLVRRSSPFGSESMLYSDMYHQYYPFFKAFRASILSGESLLYNWNVGMGIDFLGLYSYYLASPLNILSIFVPESWLLGYFSLLMPIKLGLASMFFSIFLRKVFDKYDLSISLFGGFYGLCAWALGYQWNIMWLDTFALLPLVMLGMVSLLRDKKFVLYTFTLFLSVYINYYIGFFTCIFVLLGFICYQICRCKNIVDFLKDLGRIAIFSILAIGMTAIVSLPTLAALQNTQSSVNTFPEGFNLNMTNEDNWMGLFKTMVHVAGNMNAGIEPTFKEGLPNLYCGVFANILIFLFLFNKNIRVRDKICTVVLLLFFNVSFIVRQLDYIWHGFHFTNMIPYRFSFLYSFVSLYMAYNAWNNRQHIRLWQLIVAAIGAIGILLCYTDLSNIVLLAYNGVLILLYIGVLVYYCTFRPEPKDEEDEEKLLQYRQAKSKRKSICCFIFLCIMAAELALNGINFSINFPSTNVSAYPRGTTATASVLEYMQEREKNNPFYRTEVTHTQTLNDGALNGYYGISTFTSSANVNVTRFMKALGYAAKDTYNRYCFEESSPVANLFLGLKYMVARDGNIEENPYFDDIYSVGNVHLLENNAYLPLGFLTNAQLLNVDFNTQENPFSFQNRLIRQSTGLNRDVWYQLPSTMLTITGDCPTLSPQPTTGYCAYTTEGSSGSIIYSYTANREGLLCVNLDLSKRNNFAFRINGTKLYNETYSLPQMLSVCKVTPGDVVEIEMDCNPNENGTIKISAAVLNEESFRQAHDILAESTLELTKFSNTKLEGTIDCTRDGVMYTSIPQDGNWHAYVDGKEVDTVLIGDAMIGLLLSEGQHTIAFKYHNDAFSLGWKISLICLLAFAGAYWFAYKPNFKRKKGKYEA